MAVVEAVEIVITDRAICRAGSRRAVYSEVSAMVRLSA
jgi:hypothetical protein